MKKVKLSFVKLIALFQKKKYKIQSFYCENEMVRFIECRTPLYQKTFFVYIPDRYFLKAVPGKHKVHPILASDASPSAYHIKYVSSLKENDVNCELVEITNKDLFMLETNASYKYYIFSDGFSKKEDTPSNKEENAKTKEILNETKKLLKKANAPPPPKPASIITPKKEEEDIIFSEKLEEEYYEMEEEEEEFYRKQEEEALDEESEMEEGDDVSEAEAKEEEIQEDSPTVEIIFENEKGDLVDTVKNAIDLLGEDTIPELHRKIEDIEEEEDEEETDIVGNTLPPSLDELQTHLGMVCICVSIHLFIKAMDQYESVFLKNYAKLEANEEKYREESVENIKKLCEKYSEKVKLKIEEWVLKEKSLKDEIVKLTGVIKQLSELKQKLSSDPEKIKAELPKIENVQKQTEELIYELNIEILKIKDGMDEFLANHTFTLQHTLKL